MAKNPNVNYDWKKIKKEYITDDSTSYRGLAAKYGVTPNAIYHRAKKECWVEARRRHFDRVVAKSIEVAEETEADRLTRLLSVSDKLLLRVERFLEDDSAVIPPTQLESIAKVLKTIRDIQKGDRDDRVQIDVVFGDETEDFAQ